MPHPAGILVFERFFRSVAMIQVDKIDVRRFRELLPQGMQQPPANVTFAEESEQLLPELFGGLSVALARSFRLVDPRLANPATEHRERAFEMFRLVF